MRRLIDPQLQLTAAPVVALPEITIDPELVKSYEEVWKQALEIPLLDEDKKHVKKYETHNKTNSMHNITPFHSLIFFFFVTKLTPNVNCFWSSF